MEKKEIKISLTTFIVGIIAIVLLVLCVGMGIYISKIDKNQTNNPSTANIQNKTSTIDENNAEELDVNSELVQKLYSYMSDSEGYIMISAYDDSMMYVNGKSTIDTISNDVKLLTVITRMLQTKEYTEIKANTFPQVYYYDNEGYGLYDFKITSKSYWYNYETKKWELNYFWEAGDSVAIDQDVKIFNVNNIQKVAKEIFNEELKIEKHSYQFLEQALIYDNGEYKLISYEGGGDMGCYFERKIIKAEKENSNIYIYDNYIAMKDKYITNENGVYNAGLEYYTALDEKKQIKSSNSNKEINLMSEKDDKTYELNPQKAEEYGITLPIYKHTFTKSENGNYYWVSTELTNY